MIHIMSCLCYSISVPLSSLSLICGVIWKSLLKGECYTDFLRGSLWSEALWELRMVNSLNWNIGHSKWLKVWFFSQSLMWTHFSMGRQLIIGDAVHFPNQYTVLWLTSGIWLGLTFRDDFHLIFSFFSVSTWPEWLVLWNHEIFHLQSNPLFPFSLVRVPMNVFPQWVLCHSGKLWYHMFLYWRGPHTPNRKHLQPNKSSWAVCSVVKNWDRTGWAERDYEFIFSVSFLLNILVICI